MSDEIPLNDSYFVLFESINSKLTPYLNNLPTKLEKEVISYFQDKVIDAKDSGKFITLNGQNIECFYSPFDDKSKFYVVAFLSGHTKGTLELFASDIGAFLEKIKFLLKEEDTKKLEQKLSQWYSYCVNYTLYTTELLGNNIASLLHLALCNGHLSVDAPTDVKWNIERFVEACRLSNLIHHLKIDDFHLEIKVSKKEKSVHISFTDTLPYCQQWADRILATLPDQDPLIIRKMLENFQLKTVQDINTLKRLVKKAENDYYALFKVYQCLKTCGYPQVLLHCLKQDSPPSSLEIIDLLEDYMNHPLQL